MPASNYQDVLDQLHAAGLQGRGVDDGLQIGRMVRCKVEGERERRGWYMLHELQAPGGDLFIVGSFGVWHGNDNGAQKIALNKNEFTTEQREALRKRLADDKKRADAARKAEHERAALAAGKAWSQCVEVSDNQYLARKSVQSYGLKQTPGGVLMVPMLDTSGRIHGLQYIRTAAEAKNSQRPEKEFWPAGLAMKGHMFLIGTPQHVVLLAEGYATGASLHAATGLPVAIVFTANNIEPVAQALRKRYRGVKVLICADDDAFSHCSLMVDGEKCGQRFVLAEHPTLCPKCGGAHGKQNAGVSAASSAALAVGGAWLRPVFADEPARVARYMAQGHKHTDFNDLHLDDGLQAVRVQVEAHMLGLSISAGAPRGRKAKQGEGVSALSPIENTDELLSRFSLVYGQGGTVFDAQEHRLLTLGDMRDACLNRNLHRAWAEHPDRIIVRVEQVGFDPTGRDKNITCNLWAGWPTTPQAGQCTRLLELLRYMCSADTHPDMLYNWVLRWLAYPLQHPGAKMKTTLVLHGPQGTGKNMFFEALMSIYGKYGRIIDQGAIEDKFNDWASRKLFLIADEVVARSDLYHIKNKLKAFITGEWIRINPKNMNAYDERNHVNVVFLSNEIMPVVLEEDDRRHVVIWTPDKLAAEFYRAVSAEIESGGSAALHDYLLNVDLGDFSPASPPPMTVAKDDLITLGLDSTSRFYYALDAGDIGDCKPMPALSEDVFELYKIWCARTGNRPANQPKLVHSLRRRHGIASYKKRYHVNAMQQSLRAVLMMGPVVAQEKSESVYLGESIEAFKKLVSGYRGNYAE